MLEHVTVRENEAKPSQAVPIQDKVESLPFSSIAALVVGQVMMDPEDDPSITQDYMDFQSWARESVDKVCFWGGVPCPPDTAQRPFCGQGGQHQITP